MWLAFGAGLLSFRLTGLALLVVTLVTKDMAQSNAWSSAFRMGLAIGGAGILTRRSLKQRIAAEQSVKFESVGRVAEKLR